MRKSFPVSLPPGATWPGVTDGAPNIDAIRPYRFIRIHNRAAAAVAVGLDGKVQNSPLDYWDLVPGGARITRNVGGEHDEPARGLSLLNIDAVNTAVLRVEISDSPIIDIDHALSGSSSSPTIVGLAPSATGTPSSVASATASTVRLPPNPARKGFALYNESTAVLYLLLGVGPASLTTYTLQIAAGGYYEVPFNFTGQLTGIWSAANGFARITELT